MKNYEKVIKENPTNWYNWFIKSMARNIINTYFIDSLDTFMKNDAIYICDDGKRYHNYEEAIDAEIKWLNKTID